MSSVSVCLIRRRRSARAEKRRLLAHGNLVHEGSGNPVAMSYHRDDGRRRVTVITTGTVTSEEILAMVDRQAAEGTWAYAMLYDACRVTSVATASEVRAMAHHVQMLERLHGLRGPVAVLTYQDAIYSMARMYSTVSHQRVAIFRDPSDAERWLVESMASEA